MPRWGHVRCQCHDTIYLGVVLFCVKYYETVQDQCHLDCYVRRKIFVFRKFDDYSFICDGHNSWAGQKYFAHVFEG